MCFQGRVVIADSWFGQVSCALQLFKRGLFCIMNVKNATKGYPKAEIMRHVDEIKGNSAEARKKRAERRGRAVAFEKTFKVGTKSVNLTAAGHNKKVPLLLVASASSMIEGEEHIKRWTTTSASGEQVTHERRTRQPEMHQMYRKYMNLVDLHNKLRQGERSMADAWGTHRWENRHFAEMLGFVEVNIFKSLQYFKKGRWAKMHHNEFRRRLAHTFMTLGQATFPDDLVVSADNYSQSSGGFGNSSTPLSVDSASAMFAGPSHEHVFVPFNREKREAHTCAYCGVITTKYCKTCCDLGRGMIAACGRKSGRQCIDDHARGAPLKHGNWKSVSKIGASGDAVSPTVMPEYEVPAKRTRRRRCVDA